MDRTPLIEPAELERRLGAQGPIIVDCRHDLVAADAGAAAYARSHIPGAFHAHADRDLASPITAASGRHPLPSVDAFRVTLRRWGVDPDSEVVVYDDSNGATAARLWWMLRWVGHSRVALLNGGWKQWLAHGGPQSADVPAAAAGTFQPRADRAQWVSTDEVAARVGKPGLLLVDARGADRFAGRSEPIDVVAGHVPGAINHPFTLNLDSAARFLPADELRTRWQRTLAGRAPSEVIAMCGSGVSACHNLLALEIAGLSGGKLYVGSWSEWIRDRARPIATSASPAPAD
jgi:thiosulfate/3-mercaptopyruvate sulfurtransferase